MTDPNIDTATGRVEEAAGVLTGNRELENQGRVDQAKGSAKRIIDRVASAITTAASATVKIA